MKKERWIALALLCALTLGVAANGAQTQSEEAAEASVTETAQAAEKVAAAAEETKEETAVQVAGTLQFSDLGAAMRANYYPIFILQESIEDLESRDYEYREDDLRKKLNEIASAQWTMTSVLGPMGSMAAQSYQSAYDQLREQFDAVYKGEQQQDDRDAIWQYRSLQEQAVMAGEMLFASVWEYREQDAALTRTIAALDRTIEELTLRQKLGQVSDLTLEQVRVSRAQAESGQQTLRMGIEVAEMQLKNMVGADLGAPLSLGALPTVSQAQLDAMDVEKDLAAAKAASYDLRASQVKVEKFKKDTYDEVLKKLGSNEKIFEVSQVKHALKAYQYEQENTERTFEINFRTLYAKVQNCAQVLSAKRTALAGEEKTYAAAAMRYRQGNISANALADAKDALAAAKDEVSTAQRELFVAYRTYEYAVEHGILNG